MDTYRSEYTIGQTRARNTMDARDDRYYSGGHRCTKLMRLYKNNAFVKKDPLVADRVRYVRGLLPR
jgi:hypothetical protein